MLAPFSTGRVPAHPRPRKAATPNPWIRGPTEVGLAMQSVLVQLQFDCEASRESWSGLVSVPPEFFKQWRVWVRCWCGCRYCPDWAAHEVSVSPPPKVV